MSWSLSASYPESQGLWRQAWGLGLHEATAPTCLSELFGGFKVWSGSALSFEQAPEEDTQVCHQVSSSDGCSSTFGVAKQQGIPPPPRPSVLVMTSYLQDAPGKGEAPVKASDIFSELTPNYFSSPAAAAAAKSLQSCPTLCDPRDGSPPDSPVPGILQARTLEWVAISFSNAWKWKAKVISSPKNSLIRVNRQKAERHSLKPFSFPIAKEWAASVIDVLEAGFKAQRQ